MSTQQKAAGRTAANHNSALDKQANHSTPTESCTKQRQAILRYLQTGSHLTTLHARQVMGIMHPAARVQSLRGLGHNIVTHWSVEEDVTGKPHRVAEYVLSHGEVAP